MGGEKPTASQTASITSSDQPDLPDFSRETLKNMGMRLITTWVQCSSIYASVLATKHGEYIPELLAYMRDIIRVSKQFKWLAWIIYDTNYRQQAHG